MEINGVAVTKGEKERAESLGLSALEQIKFIQEERRAIQNAIESNIKSFPMDRTRNAIPYGIVDISAAERERFRTIRMPDAYLQAFVKNEREEIKGAKKHTWNKNKPL